MDFAVNDEHRDLGQLVAGFLTKHSTGIDVRLAMESEAGFDPELWRRLASELDLCGLAVPVRHGGAGCGFIELCVVLEELGASLACVPFFSSVMLAQTLLLELADQDRIEEFLPALADGTKRATVALAEAAGRWDESAIEASAAPVGDGWRVNGTKMYVLDGCTADLILVAARTRSGVSVLAVEGDAPGLGRTPLPVMDRTRRQARLDLTDAPGRLIGNEGAAWPALARMLDLAAVALAAEQVGASRRCLDMTVNYARQRTQFDRVIGSFQSIKHLCADMLIDLECARSALLHGVWAATENPAELPVSASLVKSFCSEAFLNIAKSTIQVHGGIGFTWEHPAHLYFKRAKTSQILFGDTTYHRALLANRIAI